MMKRLFAFAVLGFSLSWPCHAEEKIQSLDSIYGFVKETIEQNLKTSAEYEINVLPLDNQLRLAECTQALEVFKSTEIVKAGRATLGIRCNAEKKWSIFVSAIIKVYENVIVLTRAVQRGDVITAQHLATEKRDVSKYRGDFLTEVGQVEGKQATRNLAAGFVLGAKSLVEPPMVRRKDKVTITSAQPGFAIQMSGIAMTDGAKGQLIRVKNESSGRIIGAVVIEPGLVQAK